MSEADISQHSYLLLMAKLITTPCPVRVQLPGDPFAPTQAGPCLPQQHLQKPLWGVGVAGATMHKSLCMQLGVEQQLLLIAALLLQSRSRN